MAEFIEAFDDMIRNEGGCHFHNAAGDRGGDTYSGVTRRAQPGQ